MFIPNRSDNEARKRLMERAEQEKKAVQEKKATQKKKQSSSTKSGGAKTEKSSSQSSSVGSKVGSILGKTTAPTINYSSAINLGLGPISKEKTIELVNSGQVTIDNNKFKWKNEPIKSTTTTIKSDIPEKERKARIKDIDTELKDLNIKLSGYSRAKAYGTSKAMEAEEQKVKDRISELSKEKKKLQRVGTFTSSEMKQFEIDDLKAKKNSLPTYNPTARIAPSGVEAYKNNLAAHSALDKEINRLEREKAEYIKVEKLDKLNAYTKQITSKSDFEAGSKYSPAKPKTAKELQAEGYKQAQDGSWYKNSLFGGTFYAGEDSDIYVYINDPSKRATIGANKRKESSKASTAFGGGAPSGGTDTYAMMGYHTLTDDEIGAFNYLYHQDRKNGTNKAMEYLNKITPLLQERAMQQEALRYKDLSKDSPIMMSALSLGTNLANAAMFPAKAAATATGVYDEMPLLDMYGNRTTAIRGGVSEDMGDWGKLFYNAGMSIGDMGVALAVGGGNAKIVQAVMSSSAGSSTISEAKKNGASDGKALVLGLGSAAIEWATEKYSVEAILKQPKSILGFVATNTFTEATEEGASNISNMALDAIVSEVFGERNELEQRIDYLVLYEGKTEEEALQIAVNEKLQSLGEDILVGGMTGFGMSGTKATAIATQKAVKNAQTQRDVLDNYIKDEKSLSALITSAKEGGEGTKAFKSAEEVEQAQKEGTLSKSQVKQLIKATDKQIKAESKAEDKTDTLDLATMETGEGALFDKLPLRERLQLISEGSNVSTKDIKKATGFGDEGVSLVSSLVSNKGMNVDQAYSAVKTAYSVGYTNVKKEKVNFATPLQEQAFDAGKKDRVMADADDKANAQKASVYDGAFIEKYKRNFTDDERKMIYTVSNHFGMDTAVVEEIIASEITDPETGEVTKFRAAGEHQDGKLTISGTTQKIIYKLVMHETGHRMKQLAPTEFGTLMDALYQRRMRRNSEMGIDATANLDFIKAEHDTAGIEMSTGKYLEEFAVRELEDIFGSAEAFNKWVNEIDSDAKTKSAWDRFTTWLKEVFEDIKMRMSGMSRAEREAAKRETAELDRIMELLEGTYKSARDNATELKSKQTETNSSKNLEIKTNEEYNGNKDYSLDNEGYSTKGTHWAIANGLLSEQEQALFWKDISNLTHRGLYIPQSKSGQYMIDLGQKLVFTNGDYKKTTISCIIEFIDGYEENIYEYKEWIINEERDTAQHGESLQIVEILQGAGYVSEHFPSDYRANARQNGQGKGTNSKGNSSKTSKGSTLTNYSLEGEDINKLSTEEQKAVKALGEGAEAITNKKGEMLIATNKDKSTVMYSLETYNNGGKKKLEMVLRANGHTEAEIYETLSWVDDAADYLTYLAAKYAKSHNYKALSDHLIADVITNVKTGKQVLSTLVNNGEYPVNFDLALNCKKRIAYMNLMSRLIDDGIFDKVNYGGEAIAKVNELLRKNGFETACLGCFVESRRLQFQTWAETIVSEWNAEVDKRKSGAGNFDFAKGEAKLTDAELDALAEELKNAGKKNAQGNLNLGQGSVQTRMGRLLDKVPSLQKHLTVADLLKPEGLTALRAYDSNLFSLVKSRYGAASPKIVQDYNPYASEIAMMTFSFVKNITSNAVKGADAYRRSVINSMGGRPVKQKGETTKAFNERKAEFNAKVEDEAIRRYLYDIGGARIQSFSDFMIENVFDYIQIFADLSAKRLPLHGYTKEIIALRLFGMTGAKWNGSWIAHVERDMGKEYAGLLPASEAKNGNAILVHTKDGDFAIGFDDYARHKATNGDSFIQSIGMNDMVALQLDPRYSPHVGSITIGVSDKQILAMLDSPLFRFVIPYHSSGMLPQFAKLVGVDMYNDYTDYQNTTVKQWYDTLGNPVAPIKDGKGDVLKVDTSYNFNAEVQKTGDAKKAAANYLKWCGEQHPVYDGKKRVGYVTFNPKFSNSPYGTDFTKHENYYKMLEDFNVYDNISEESAVQGAVTMTFPSEQNRLSATEMEAYKQRLRDTGIFTEKEIEKYSKIADKTFKELVADEVKGRAEYQKAQEPKWESTVKNVEDMLLGDHKREGKMHSLEGGLSNKEASEAIAKYAKGEAITTEKYKELVKTYGAIKKGEKPHRDVTVPSQTSEDKKVSQTVRTILEAEVTPDEAVPTIEKMVEDGVFSYDVYTDQEAIENGEDYIKEHGWEQSLVDWFDAVKNGEVSKDITTTGWILYNHAANSGDAKTAIMILDAMIRHQRNAAQALQATRILKKLSPETQLYGVQKSVNAFQNELKEKYGKKAPDLEIDEELAEQFLNAETQEERDAVTKKIYKDIGRQMPSRFIDKWNAWRYLAMLGNPRTHVRNIFGNAFFAPVVATKNLTATAIESIVAPVVSLSGKKMLRGKSIVWGSKTDRALLKAAWSDYANVADAISNGGKYSDFALENKYMEEGRKVFKSKLFAPVEWARKGNSKLLEVEDVWFSMPHYAYALAQYCKANNISAEQIQKGIAIAPAREYAIKEAQKATYKDTNAFSQMVSEWGRNHNEKNVVKKAFNTVVEGVLPFRKTPANILVRGIEYSPLGLLKSLSYDLVQVSKGKMNAHEMIDNISAGLTGTGLVALGVYLAAQGLVRGHGEDEEEERKFKEMQGHQAYSLELPSGESITLDWLAPEALPFFVGVNLLEVTTGSDKEANLSAILKSVSNITEPMLEMSCLQGLNDLIEGVGNASSEDTSGLMAILSSAVTSYLTQGIPTLFGQFERTSEEERMTTYTEKNDFLTGDLQYTLGKASAKIPYWDYNQIPYIDAWGRKEASGTKLKRGLNNFLNPAYTSKIESSETEKELLRLYDATGEASVFPERAEKWFMADSIRKDLTADEYVRYATLKGQKSYDLVTELVQSKEYKNLTDEEKVKAIQDAYSYANQKAKKAISNYKPEKWVEKADELGDVDSYIFFRTNVNEVRESNDGKIKKAEVVDIIGNTTQDDSEAWSLYLSMYDYPQAHEAEKHGIDADTYMNAVVAMYDIHSDYYYNGKIVDGAELTAEQRKTLKYVRNSRRRKVEKYLNSVCNSYKDYLFLLGTEYSSITDDADYVSYFGK